MCVDKLERDTGGEMMPGCVCFKVFRNDNYKVDAEK